MPTALTFMKENEILVDKQREVIKDLHLKALKLDLLAEECGNKEAVALASSIRASLALVEASASKRSALFYKMINQFV